MEQSYKDNLIDIKDDSIRQGFVILPRKVVRAQGLSLQAKMAYALLLDYAWQKGSCFPGQARMAKDLGVHRNTIYRLLTELKDFGLITSQQRPNKTNIYHILPLDTVPKLNTHSVDAQSMVDSGSQSMVQQDSPSMVKEIETVEYTQNKYKQSLTLGNGNEHLNLNDFDKRAVIIAQDLDDLKSIRYYQKIINEEKKGLINPQDIDDALEFARREKRRDQVDGKFLIKSPGALFHNFLGELKEKRRTRENRPKNNYEIEREKLLKKMSVNSVIGKTQEELNQEIIRRFNELNSS